MVGVVRLSSGDIDDWAQGLASVENVVSSATDELVRGQADGAVYVKAPR